jgi:flavin reductase (DIM6/NTAB) family NADH-FMN oxidoreductase RutF
VHDPAETRDLGAEQRELFRRWPAGVSVVVAESEGRRAGLTVSSLVSISLDPPLAAISLAHVASLYEVLREAGEWTASILSGEQDWIAQHFARSVPPLVLWDGIPVRDDDPRLIANAVGWLWARTLEVVRAGDHTVFLAEVLDLERGPATSSLVYVNRSYTGV